MQHNQHPVPASGNFDDVWFDYDDPERREIQWPAVARHEPMLEGTDRSSLHKRPKLYRCRSSCNNSTSSCTPRRQDDNSAKAYSERNKPNTPPKYPDDGWTLPSEKHARHDETLSQKEQENAEETARDILGPRIVDLPTI